MAALVAPESTGCKHIKHCFISAPGDANGGMGRKTITALGTIRTYLVYVGGEANREII